MSSTKSGSHTVEFRGDKDLTLVGDEWNRDVASAAQHPTILMLHGGGQNRYRGRTPVRSWPIRAST